MAKKKVTIKTKKKKAKKATPAPSSGLDLSKLPEEVVDRARDIWLAGLGALSAVQEEGGKVFNDLVNKGEQWERERIDDLGSAKKQVDEAVKEAQKRGQSAKSELDKRLGQLEDSLERLMDRFNAIVRDEVKQVAARVDRLSHQVETLAGEASSQTARQASEAAASARKAAAQVTARTTYAVRPHDEGWAVWKVGNRQASSVHGTKKEATSAGRELAQDHRPSELVLHRQDGTVQDSYSYDPEEE